MVRDTGMYLHRGWMMPSSQRLFWSRNPAKFRSHWLYDAIHSAAVLTSETRDDVVARS